MLASLAGLTPVSPLALTSPSSVAGLDTSIDTTAHYAQANIATKRVALDRLASPTKPARAPSWRHRQDVLTWLDTM